MMVFGNAEDGDNYGLDHLEGIRLDDLKNTPSLLLLVR